MIMISWKMRMGGHHWLTEKPQKVNIEQEGWREIGEKRETTIYNCPNSLEPLIYYSPIGISDSFSLSNYIENWKPCQSNDHDTSLATGYFMST